MKSERLHAKGLWIDTNYDMNGRYWIAWKPNVTRVFRDSKEMIKWLAWPPKTPTGDALRCWVNSLLDEDSKRKTRPKPIGDANVENSFDPLAHDSGIDESDPNFATRTVI